MPVLAGANPSGKKAVLAQIPDICGSLTGRRCEVLIGLVLGSHLSSIGLAPVPLVFGVSHGVSSGPHGQHGLGQIHDFALIHHLVDEPDVGGLLRVVWSIPSASGASFSCLRLAHIVEDAVHPLVVLVVRPQIELERKRQIVVLFLHGHVAVESGIGWQ